MTSFRAIWIAVTAAVVALSGAVGCGSGELTVGESDEQPEQEPPEEQFDPGEPAKIVIDLSPTRYVYDVGTSIQPTARVFDTDWEELPDAEVAWTISPETAAERTDEGDWVVQREADVIFEGCVVGEDGVATTVCDKRSAPTANSGRQLVVESPRPGEHFSGTATETIPVAGSVEGALAPESVLVNGHPADIDDDGSFSYDLEPKFGVNTITVEAYDGIHDDEVVEVTSAMWAPDYQEPDLQAGIDVWLEEALKLSVGQNFLDDGEDYLEPSDTEIVTRDLGDLLTLVIEHLDFAAEIPDPVIDSSTTQLSISDVTIGEPEVDLMVTNNGLEVFGRIHDLQAYTDGHVELSGETIDLGGSVTTTVSLYSAVDITKESYDQDFDTEVVDLVLAVDQVEPDFDAEEANALFELADSALRDNIEQIILDSLDLSFVESLPDVLEDFLASIDDTIADQQLVMDLGYGEPLTMTFGGRVEEFSPAWSRGLEMSIAAGASINGVDPLYPDVPGVALFDPNAEHSPLLEEGRLQVGLGFDVLNAIYFAVWNAGMFDIDITQVVPEGVENLIDDGHVEALLPPVLGPPPGDSSHDFVVHLGQLELQLDWPDQSDRYGLEIIVGADIAIEDGQFMINVGDDPEINMWLIETTGESPELATAEFRDAIETLFWPDMKESIEESIDAFQLPTPDFGVIDSFAPGLTDLELEIKLDRPPTERSGFLMLDASIEGTLQTD